LQRSVEILWLLWLKCVGLLIGKVLEVGWELVLGIGLDEMLVLQVGVWIEMLVLWVGVWIDWCLLLLVCV